LLWETSLSAEKDFQSNGTFKYAPQAPLKASVRVAG